MHNDNIPNTFIPDEIEKNNENIIEKLRKIPDPSFFMELYRQQKFSYFHLKIPSNKNFDYFNSELFLLKTKINDCKENNIKKKLINININEDSHYINKLESNGIEHKNNISYVNENTNENNTIINCFFKDCQETFKNFNNLVEHIHINHLKNKVFKCVFCEKIFNDFSCK